MDANQLDGRMMDEATDKATVRVGFGQPPVEHRFQKGRSGNPKGRPKHPTAPPPRYEDRPLDRTMETEFLRPIRLREDGEVREVSAAVALLRAMLQSAITTKNRLAQRQLLELIRDEEARVTARNRQFYIYWMEYKRDAEAEIDRCLRQGREPPTYLPHPFDILPDPVRREVHFLGPIDAAELPAVRRLELTRDLCLGLSAKQSISNGVVRGAWFDEGKCFKTGYAALIHGELPPSHQRGRLGFETLCNAWRNLGKRQILRRIAEIEAEMELLPPPDVAKFIERRAKSKRTSMIAIGIAGQLMRLESEALAQGRAIDAASAQELVDEGLAAIKRANAS